MNRALSLCCLLTLALGCTSGKENEGPPSSPQVSADAEKLTVGRQTLTDVTVAESVMIQNAGATPARAVGSHWELVFDGNVIAAGDERLDVAIPAGGSAEATLTGQGIYAKDAQAVQALSQHRGGFPVALRGTLLVEGAGGGRASLPFAKANLLREPRLVQVVMTDVGASHYDDGHVNVIFSLALDNPNPFPVPVSGFSYKIAVNGYPVADAVAVEGTEIPGSTKKVFEITATLDPRQFKDLPQIYETNTMRYALTGLLDLGLSKADVSLESPITFSR